MWSKYKQIAGWIIGVVLLLGCGFMVGRIQSNQFGVLDSSRLLAESPKLLSLQTQLAVKDRELAGRLEQETAGLKPEQAAAARQAAVAEYRQFQLGIEEQAQAMIRQAVDAVASERGLVTVFFKTGVAKGGVDVTNDVLKKL